eukprot:5464279-Pyramimonas_sp.AAC.1
MLFANRPTTPDAIVRLGRQQAAQNWDTGNVCFPVPREEDAPPCLPVGLTLQHLLRSSDQTALERGRCRTTEPSTIDVGSFQSA